MPLTFKWWPDVTQTNKLPQEHAVNIVYKDNTIQKIRQLEWSVLEMKVTWEVVESEPAAPTFSAVHTIQCSRITHPDNHCFFAWTTDFSSDVSTAVLEDSKYKKHEAFAGLEAFLKP